ncbi:ABC transporter permease [Pilimelia columellifera]|uniref:ABC transporter permease n=1 Tax=Pilimelia columellifera TaxID=706574 RepID=UPI0031D736C2
MTRSWVTRGALGVLGLLVAAAIAGPWLAPYPPTDVVGAPFAPPGPGAPLGTDYLGGDVASRLLHGGRTVIGLALAATALGLFAGAAVGVAAGLSGRADAALMRPIDVLLAVPPFLVLAVLAAGSGRGMLVVVGATALANVPGIARVVRAAVLETRTRGYVEVALARGESWLSVAGRDILPNIAATMLSDVGSRVSAAIAMVAGANFLGFGLQPPTADWALMVAENRSGLALQPWAVLAPATAIAVLTIAVNIGGDQLAARLRGAAGRRRFRPAADDVPAAAR